MPRNNVVPKVIQECAGDLLGLAGKMMEAYDPETAEYKYALMIGGAGAVVRESAERNNLWPMNLMIVAMSKAAAEIEAVVNGTNN